MNPSIIGQIFMQRISYIFHKLYTKFLVHFGKFKKNGCALIHQNFKLPDINSKTKIALVFYDESLTHLGDQLFFDVLIQNLTFKFMNVEILPTRSMEQYFTFFKHKMITKERFNPNSYDIIISRIEEFFIHKDSLTKTVFINTVDFDLQNRITQEICISVFKIFGISDKINFFSPRVPVTSFVFDLDKNKKYLLYSNYVDSGWFRIKNRDYKNLEDLAIQIATKQNLTIIHLGTHKDKLKDKKTLSYQNYIDLRGKTSVIDIFSICSLKNVVGCVTFDTFVFHAATLAKLRCYVRIKNGSSQKLAFIKRCIVPCVESKEDIKFF